MRGHLVKGQTQIFLGLHVAATSPVGTAVRCGLLFFGRRGAVLFPKELLLERFNFLGLLRNLFLEVTQDRRIIDSVFAHFVVDGGYERLLSKRRGRNRDQKQQKKGKEMEEQEPSGSKRNRRRHTIQNLRHTKVQPDCINELIQTKMNTMCCECKGMTTNEESVGRGRRVVPLDFVATHKEEGLGDDVEGEKGKPLIFWYHEPPRTNPVF